MNRNVEKTLRSSVDTKKPCAICEKLILMNPFHPVEKCWNGRARKNSALRINLHDEFEDEGNYEASN